MRHPDEAIAPSPGVTVAVKSTFSGASPLPVLAVTRTTGGFFPPAVTVM